MTTDNFEKKYSFDEVKLIAEDIQRRYPQLHLYIVEGHYQSKEYTIRFWLPKKELGRNEQWYDEIRKEKSLSRKRWKCNKFGNLTFPKDKIKAKELSDLLFKEW